MVAWADAPAPAFGAPAAGYGTPGGYGAPVGYDAPGGYGTPGGYGAPGGYDAPGGYGMGPAAPAGTWLLPLTSAAKVLVTTFIVLGAICEVGQNVYNMQSGHSTVNNNGTSTSLVINF
jgi:hypothetical protein